MHASGDGEHGSNDKSGRPDTSASRRVSASRQSTSIDGRIARLEYHMEQILELLMQQNQKQGKYPKQNLIFRNVCLLVFRK